MKLTIKKTLIALIVIPVALFFIPPAIYLGYIVFDYYYSGAASEQAKLDNEMMNRLPSNR